MFSLVIPVYRNEGSIPELLECLERLHDELGNRLEVVFVVDGSPDRCFALLREGLKEVSFAAELVAHSRNFGSFAAIRTGLEIARGPYYAVMAADLQEPPALMRDFFLALERGGTDIVVGQRVGRADPWPSRLAANLFWGSYRRLINPEVPEGGVDVFGCNQQVREALLTLRESNSTLVGLLFWLGFRRTLIPYERQPRRHGKSAWSFRRKLRYLLDSAFAFTDLPISLLLWLGIFGVLVSVLFGGATLIGWLTGHIQEAGYTSIMLGLLFVLTMNMLGLGLIGSYVWRTFENTKNRPHAIPMHAESFRRVTEPELEPQP